MDLKRITKLHTELLTGVDTTELSPKALLKYGGILLANHTASKEVLRKLTPERAEDLRHWSSIRDFSHSEIDSVLTEIEQRLVTDGEDFGEGLLLQFIELVAKLRLAIFNESVRDEKLEENEVTPTVITLIYE